ncbi:hypothetical protein HY631_00545 [Candidatus Uhrbacteria bacterium]|nr:hypothetical protein [Candidatus Uhrbacteria bacterium]
MEIKPDAVSAAAWGLMGAIFITLAFYLIQTLGMQSFTLPIEFMTDRWYLVAPLIAGFGIQVGLFRLIRLHAARAGTGIMAASGGMSGSTMLACCMHNLVLIFPILGVSGLAAFFAAYQTQVFLVSIVIAYLGAGYLGVKYATVRRACKAHHPSLTP